MRLKKNIFLLRVRAEIEVRLKAAVVLLLKQIVPLDSIMFLNVSVVEQDIQQGFVESMNKRVPGASWDPAVPGLDWEQGGADGQYGSKG